MKDIKKLFVECGIEDVGVCSFTDDLIFPYARSKTRLPERAKSILVCLFPYFAGVPEKRNLALYCMIQDYHRVVGECLQNAVDRLQRRYPNNRFVWFVDASPIDEVQAACQAGLGLFGKNRQLLTERYGSMVFIGEIVTDLALPAGEPMGNCMNCGECIRACPTKALTEAGINRSLCRSHITQIKGVLNPQQQGEVTKGGMAWGCDRCILACPQNSEIEPTPFAAFYEEQVAILTEENLDLLMTNRAFAWKGREVVLRNLRLLNKK